ncbi:MAG: LuxR C-terminal-related transcriptional regulator [Pseudonocardia sp.]
MDVEQEWLELVAELLARPLRGYPAERVARQLMATFGARSCAYRSCGRKRVWPDGGGRVDEPGGARLILPLRGGGFVLARDTPFTRAEIALAEVLQRLLIGLDVQVRALDATAEAGGEPGVRLTPREREVLAAVTGGLTACAAAHRLGIAERTVHKHLERAYAKLGVADRVSAVLRAQRLGLLG